MATPLRLVFDPTGDLLEATRECEADIFLQWYGNTRAQLAAEYDPYEQDSVYVALADGAVVHASVRLLAPGSVRPKVLDDLERPPWELDAERSAAAVGLDLSSTWEVATLGVRPASTRRSPVLALALYHALVTAARVNRASAFIAILDQRVRSLLDAVGIVTQPFPGASTAPYLGSPHSTPVHARIAPMLDRQRRDLPDAHRLVTLGIGLDGIVVPDDESFRMRSERLVRATPREHSEPALASAAVGDLR